MSKPAKDEAELIDKMAEEIKKMYVPGLTIDGIALICISAIRQAGWAVVPVEPTREMLRAGYDESGGRAVIGIWEAMLETAPGVKP